MTASIRRRFGAPIWRPFFVGMAAIGLLAYGSAPAQTSTKSSATRKTAASKNKRKKKKGPARSTRSSKKAASWRTRQGTPTPDRYKQIQQALAEKGYYQGSPTGVWDQASADALRRFQRDQNLEPSGKLDSLSLIALGLGPKRDTSPRAP
jgi:peptidoglycan hydrolase-like protein with peptidoglycan-binding domain